MILDYYAAAPAIVDAINASEAGKKEWDHIYWEIVAITSLIDAGNPEGALGKYREMFLRLRATYLPSYREKGRVSRRH